MARASHYKYTRDAILRSVQTASSTHARAPSVRDLAQEHRVGVATMHAYLTRLAEEGVLEWRAGRHRSLHLTPQGFQELAS